MVDLNRLQDCVGNASPCIYRFVRLARYRKLTDQEVVQCLVHLKKIENALYAATMPPLYKRFWKLLKEGVNAVRTKVFRRKRDIS
jgi:hypothetical protein